MPETMTLTDADQGASHAVAVGQSVTIRLGENPTTGYRWTLDADPASAVESLGSEYTSGGTAPGAAGTREFQLRAKAPGTVHLHLKLSRSWQGGGSPVESREFTLQVAP